MSEEEQKRRDDALKRIAVVGGSEMVGKFAAIAAACEVVNEAAKKLIVLEAEPSRERGRVNPLHFLPYMMDPIVARSNIADLMHRKVKRLKPTKPCAECGEMHSHNNRWCSTECCKLYRQKEKEVRND